MELFIETMIWLFGVAAVLHLFTLALCRNTFSDKVIKVVTALAQLAVVIWGWKILS